MKVLFINSVYGRGSTGRIVAELGKVVEENGGKYKVAYGRGKKINDEHCYYMGNKFNVYMHTLLSRLTDKTGFYSKRETKKLVQFIRDYSPDIIHLHNLHGYYINVEILFKYLKEEFKGKVFWTLHDCWPFTGHCVHYTWAKCNKWQIQCSNCSEKETYPTSYLRDNSLDNYNRKKECFSGVSNMTVITVSEWLKCEVEKSFLKDYPVVCIHNGIDCDKFHPVVSDVKQKLGIVNKKMILLVSDGWNDRKGWNKFLGVAEIAPTDWSFVIVGITKEQMAILPTNAIGYEKIGAQEKLIKLYSAADAFFNPSMEETFGLVTAEAMACGTPAVVMNSTACPELIKDANCGIIVEVPAGEMEMIEAIRNAMECTGMRENVLKYFTLKKQKDGYLRLFVNKE